MEELGITEEDLEYQNAEEEDPEEQN